MAKDKGYVGHPLTAKASEWEMAEDIVAAAGSKGAREAAKKVRTETKAELSAAEARTKARGFEKGDWDAEDAARREALTYRHAEKVVNRVADDFDKGDIPARHRKSTR